MQLLHLPVWPSLQPYIHSFWLFEAPAGVPQADSRVVVPNGCLKLVLPYRGSLLAYDAQGLPTLWPEHHACFIGPWERHTVVGTGNEASASLGLEFKPQGAYRFVRFDLHEAANRLLTLQDAFGAVGLHLQNWPPCRP